MVRMTAADTAVKVLESEGVEVIDMGTFTVSVGTEPQVLPSTGVEEKRTDA